MEKAYVKSKLIKAPHAFSTRYNGVSINEFTSLNLGFEYGDDEKNVLENWKIFSREANVNINNLVWTKQTHKNKVKIISSDDINKNSNITKFESYDGLITKQADICLCIFTADCAPLLLHDNKANVIAALHCGWKPLCADIVKNGINAMKKLGAVEDNIAAAIGPCIQKCCFEVNNDVIDALNKLLKSDYKECFSPNKTKFNVSLPKAVEIRLKQLGVHHVDKIDECSCCLEDKYFSYRRDNGSTGRMANIISLT